MKKMLKKSVSLLLALVLLAGMLALPGAADETADRQLCEDFYNWYNALIGGGLAPEITVGDVKIGNDYGSYDGGRVVRMEIRNYPVTEDLLPLLIGGHIFVLGSGSYRDMFLVYQDGAFTRVTQAFDEGQLTQADIDAAYAAYLEQGGEIADWDYTDVSDADWYDAYVTVCSIKGWFSGYEDHRFCPNGTMTRAMFVKVLYWFDVTENNAQHNQPHEPYENPFADVKAGSWYEEPVAWASARGIVKGTSETTFSPNAPLTREQAVTMIKRYVDMDGGPAARKAGSFPDEQDVSDWALAAVRWMKEAGIVQGDENGNFLPQKKLSRAECAKILVKLADYVMVPHADADGAIRELTKDIEKNPAAPYTPRADGSDRLALLRFCANLAGQTLTAGQNDVVSPVSALYALGMTANGADGNTLAELERAFGLSTGELNQYLRHYGKLLTGDAQNQVNLADSVWINNQKDFTVSPSYLQALVDFYDAQAFYGPFDRELCDALNGWISDNTYGMIPKMLDEINPNAALYLVNTLALKLKWLEPYGDSAEKTFTKADGTIQPCDMLYGVEECYLQDGTCTGFVKPYENGFRFAALLPNEDVSMADFLASLTGDKLAGLLDNADTNCRVLTRMPEFETDSKFSLKEPLLAMGIQDLFSEFAADLHRMGKDDLFVSKILQDVHLKLDKNGTEAAAATVIEITDNAAPVDKPVYQVYLERPFVYMILDGESNLPLFIGVVNGMK